MSFFRRKKDKIQQVAPIEGSQQFVDVSTLNVNTVRQKSISGTYNEFPDYDSKVKGVL